jgi:DNA-binding CsgD family transcriptional regulator
LNWSNLSVMRCESRRVDAREQLRAAQEMFSQLGAEAFAERAGRELLASGEIARRRADETRGVLTAQESQIARLARDGLSNLRSVLNCSSAREPCSTTLHKVFQKLDLTSRNQLGRVPSGFLGSA